jgi:transposase
MPAFKYPDEKWGRLEEVGQMYREQKNAKMKTKLNAIHLLMKGRPRKEVAEILCVCETTIGHWRNQWNRAGKEGLKSQRKGRKSKVTDDIKAEIKEIVEIKREINGRTVTGFLIHGYLKKNTY